MSFVGYLRPVAQSHADGRPAGRRSMVTLAVGFAISAVLMTTVAHLVGEAIAELTALGTVPRAGIAAGALLACFVVNGDIFTVLPPMLRRQTPQRVFYMFGPVRGALIWGLDTGLMITTYRITATTWATLALVALGFLPLVDRRALRDRFRAAGRGCHLGHTAETWSAAQHRRARLASRQHQPTRSCCLQGRIDPSLD
jgi:small-conductance mechanosensitive channel